MVLPNDDFFPDEYHGTEYDVRRLFEQVCEYMGVGSSRVDLRFYRVGDHRALTPLDGWAWTVGLYQDKDGRAIVQIEESQFDEPLSLVATFAHELAHVRLLGEHRLEKDEEDGEQVTDLLAVFLGFGVFMANSASRTNVFLGLVEGRESSRLGYLSDTELAYALAIVAWLHCEGKPPWANLLRPNVRQPMVEAIRWLTEEEGDSELPRGRRFDNLDKADAFPVVRHPVLAYFATESAVPDEDHGDLDHFSLGIWAINGGSFDEAARELSLSIEDDPEDVEAYQQRSRTYLGQGRVEEALADAEKAVALAPDDVTSRCIRGKALVRRGRYNEAVGDFDVVIAESDPRQWSECKQLAEAYFQRGLIRALENDMSAAIRDFTRSIINVPYRPEVYEARAAAYDRQGKTKKAQRDREEAEYRRSKPPQ